MPLAWNDFFQEQRIHSYYTCGIEDFVQAHICKLCVLLGSRVLRGVHVYALIKDIDRRLTLVLASIRANRAIVGTALTPTGAEASLRASL